MTNLIPGYLHVIGYVDVSVRPMKLLRSTTNERRQRVSIIIRTTAAMIAFASTTCCVSFSTTTPSYQMLFGETPILSPQSGIATAGKSESAATATAVKAPYAAATITTIGSIKSQRTANARTPNLTLPTSVRRLNLATTTIELFLSPRSNHATAGKFESAETATATAVKAPYSAATTTTIYSKSRLTTNSSTPFLVSVGRPTTAATITSIDISAIVAVPSNKNVGGRNTTTTTTTTTAAVAFDHDEDAVIFPSPSSLRKSATVETATVKTAKTNTSTLPNSTVSNATTDVIDFREVINAPDLDCPKDEKRDASGKCRIIL